MPALDTEAITADLTRVLDAVAQAQSQVRSTTERVRRTASGAEAEGLAREAEVLGTIRFEIEQIHDTFGRAASHIQAADVAVREISGEMSPEEAKAHLEASARSIHAMRGEMLVAAQQIDEAKRRTGVVLRDVPSGPILSPLDGVRYELSAVARRVNEAESGINAATQRVS